MADTADALDWPQGFERTEPEQRQPYPHDFRVGTRQAFRNILTELQRRGAKDPRIESAARHLASNPNLPYANANPNDPGVVAYFQEDNQEFAVPCDRWSTLRDNAQAIAKYLNAKRALTRYGVETVQNTKQIQTQLYNPD